MTGGLAHQRPVHRRRAILLAATALVVAITLAACAPPARVITSRLHDDREYPATGVRGSIAVVGDSVGMGLANFGRLGDRLVWAGWGPVRTLGVTGLRSAPAWPGDTNTVATRLAEIRASGVQPSAVVVVAGANDVGFAGWGDPAVTGGKIDQAMAAIGDVPTVWLRLHHGDAGRMAAWNLTLDLAPQRHPRLHVCDWSDIWSMPGVLSTDGVHLGPTGYTLLAERTVACVDAAAPPPPPPDTTVPVTTLAG